LEGCPANHAALSPGQFANRPARELRWHFSPLS
jgi:hypothetical protein